MSRPTCCFCGKLCENEWGNNPYPVSKKVEDRCCNSCNKNIVIPERIQLLYGYRNNEKSELLDELNELSNDLEKENKRCEKEEN